MNALTLFNSFLNDDVFSGEREISYARQPKVDIIEKEKEFEINVDLPGFEEKDVTISLEGGVLKVVAERTEEKEEKDQKFLKRERLGTKYTRTFQVGDLIDDEQISAKMSNGVLSTILPKKTSAGPKVIKIN